MKHLIVMTFINNNNNYHNKKFAMSDSMVHRTISYHKTRCNTCSSSFYSQCDKQSTCDHCLKAILMILMKSTIGHRHGMDYYLVFNRIQYN